MVFPLPCLHGMSLQSRNCTQCSYLEGEGPDGLGPHLRHVALYHSTDGNRGRSVFCLLLPATKQCLVVVCVPSGGCGAGQQQLCSSLPDMPACSATH